MIDLLKQPADNKTVKTINLFSKKKQKLKKHEIEATIDKIREEYDKYIVTFHKPLSLKNAFERRYTEAKIHEVDMERFLGEEIAAIKSIYLHQNKLDKDKKDDEERARLKHQRKSQPDFADKVLQKLKDKITVYPPLRFHKDASYEIVHLYGAIREFESQHWPPLDHFISEHQSWALRGDRKDFNNDLWRFLPAGDTLIPPILERYKLLLDSTDVPLRDITREAQHCLKEAAFLLNDILWSCNNIIKKGIAGENIEKNLDFVQNVINDFRIKDLKNR